MRRLKITKCKYKITEQVRKFPVCKRDRKSCEPFVKAGEVDKQGARYKLFTKLVTQRELNDIYH